MQSFASDEVARSKEKYSSLAQDVKNSTDLILQDIENLTRRIRNLTDTIRGVFSEDSKALQIWRY